jgi:hypothetical protein
MVLLDGRPKTSMEFSFTSRNVEDVVTQGGVRWRAVAKALLYLRLLKPGLREQNGILRQFHAALQLRAPLLRTRLENLEVASAY